MAGLITPDMLAPGCALANLADGTVPFSKLTPASITTANLADGAVTGPKIAPGAVTPDKGNSVAGVQLPDWSHSAGDTWWRQAPDGFIEQGGYASSADGNDFAIQFPVPFKVKASSPHITPAGFVNTDVLVSVMADGLSLTGFVARPRQFAAAVGHPTTSQQPFYWSVRGY